VIAHMCMHMHMHMLCMCMSVAKMLQHTVTTPVTLETLNWARPDLAARAAWARVV
jgi:hypothetical protein